MIAIIDYGMGNLRSVHNAFAWVGYEALVTRDPQRIADADGVVLPGVGAFGDCMANLARYDLIDSIHRSIGSGKPFLGICLGLQVLFTESEEFGTHKGLAIIPGRVRRFHFSAVRPMAGSPLESLKIPHMGWNGIKIIRPAPIFNGVASESRCYFVHSYYVEPDDSGVIASVTDYGGPFVSAIWRDNVIACQFHPEKSQAIGLQIIRNFGAWVR